MRTIIATCFMFIALPNFLVANERIDYTTQVKPILSRHCLECHDAKVQKGGLRLDSAKAIFQGGDSGTSVVAGDAKKSLLIDVLHADSVYPRMPYKRSPLKAAEVKILTQWIAEGAVAPKDEKVFDVRDHWAFQAPKRPALPNVGNNAWVRNAIDAFILARLQEDKLKPSPEADRRTLIRRVSLDLTGLPPTPAEVDAFLKDTSPQAYEKVVDRLLQSPHYGEKWARHWLDLARYADTHGFTIDGPREIWKYRDWVIEALNKDKPFDQFVIEQFAGDLLPKATQAQKIATGFHRNTLINQEGGIDPEQFRVDAVADRVDTTGVVFLGLTLGCARCHDHKYDPITQKEYYQLFAFLNNQSEPTLSIATPELAAKREKMTKDMEDLEIELNEHLQTYANKNKVSEQLAEILRLRPEQRTDQQKAALAKHFRSKTDTFKGYFQKLDQMKKTMPRFPTTMVLAELAKPRETHLMIMGDFTRKGELVQPNVPALLQSLPPSKDRPNRLDLARWLVDEKNPLVARVTVNRLWQRYFGKGIVETENDFGTQGSAPTHPQLLDWLATEFMRQKWSLKAMHRLIVTSATYRQSSTVQAEAQKVDPYNKLLAYQNRLRLDAELIRDNALAVSGLLSPKIGGPGVFPPQPEGIYRFTQVNRPWKTSKGGDRYRRGLYTYFQRSAPYPGLIVFDAPNANSTCTKRVRSNTPLQALTLLNDQSYLELAAGLAGRILRESPKTRKDRVAYAFQICLSRPPTDWEAGKVEAYVEQQLQEFRRSPKDAKSFLQIGNALSQEGTLADAELAEQAAWVATARALMNLDEFITRE